MPPLETERHQLKRELAQRFTKQAETIPDRHTETTKGAEQKKGAERAAPKRGGKDVER